MKRTHVPLRLAPLALALVPCIAACGCSEQGGAQAPAGQGAAGAAQGAAAAQQAAPRTPERAAQRSRERWEKVVAKDTVAAYAFLAPDYQRARPLGQEIEQATNHQYSNPKVVEVVGQKDDDVYLRVTATWTPKHPILKQVHLDPGQSLDQLTQEIEVIEGWRWVGTDWFLNERFRPEEFAQAHADLLKGAAAAPAGEKKPN